MSTSDALMITDPMSKKIVLKSCYGKTNHKLRLEPCRNGHTGEWLGVAKLSEEEKRQAKYIVVPGQTYLEITDGYVFDLTNDKARIDWEWVRHCPQIAGARADTNHAIKGDEQEDFRNYEGADKEFYVFDEEGETTREERRLSKEFEAEKYVHDQSATSIYHVARLLGSNMENSSPSAVRNFLVSKARKHPDQVLKLSRDSAQAQKSRLFLYAALDKEIIRRRQGVYYYNDTPLGTSEDQALLWLQEDRNYTLVRGMALELAPDRQPKAVVSQANTELFERAFSPATPHDAAATNPELTPAGPALPTGGDDSNEPSLEEMDQLGAPAAPAVSIAPPAPAPAAAPAPAPAAPAATLPRAQAARQAAAQTPPAKPAGS